MEDKEYIERETKGFRQWLIQQGIDPNLSLDELERMGVISLTNPEHPNPPLGHDDL